MYCLLKSTLEAIFFEVVELLTNKDKFRKQNTNIENCF